MLVESEVSKQLPSVDDERTRIIKAVIEEVRPNLQRDGVRVFVDNKSHEYLAGTTIDFVVALEGSGFTFENPNAKASCGCGKSFG